MTRPASSLEEIAASTRRTVEVEGLAFVVRRIPAGEVEAALGRQTGKSISEVAAYMRDVGRRGLVTKLRFDEEGDGPSWEDLSFGQQSVIVAAIVEFTTEGLKEIGPTLATFRGGGEGGAARGTNGSGSPAPVPDEAAAPA